MRLLQVPTGSGEVIDLHPALSVVTGLTAEQRQVLIDVVAGLPAGEARCAGLVEAHDVLFDLDDDVLDLFELGDQQVDPVVGPGARTAHDADGQPPPGPAVPEPAGDDAPTAPEVLDAARAEVDEASRALAAAAAALHAATTAREEAATTASACSAAVRETGGPDGADGVGDDAASDGPTTDLEAARQRLALAEAAALAARDAGSEAQGAGDAGDTTGLRGRREDLEIRRTELRGLLSVLGDGPADEVIDLLAELDGTDAPAEHDPQALALADEVTALVATLDELPAAEPGSPSLEAARQRLDRARAALEAAEAARRDPSPDDAVVAVERAHEDLLAALDDDARRFRRARAQQRVEHARAAEQAALAELGLNSYTDFLTGGPRSTRSDGVAEVDDARAELAAAEEAVVRAEGAARTEQRRTEVSGALADALDRAASLVGRPLRDDPLRVARALRTVVAQPPARRDDLVGALSRAGVALIGTADDGTDAASASDGTGSASDVELDLADLELLARALVDEAQTNAVRRQTALAELEQVESELAAVEVRLAGSGTPPAGSAAVEQPDGAARGALDHDPDVRSAREALRAAEAALAEQADERAAAQVRLASAAAAELAVAEGQAAARAELDHAEAALAAAEARLAEAEAGALTASTTAGSEPAEVAAQVPVQVPVPDDADAAADDLAAGGLASLEWLVLSRMMAQRAVSYVGGLPLVLDRTLDSLDPVAMSSVLSRLEPTTSSVQLIVLTESEGAIRWAEEVGPDRAAVVRPGPAPR